MRSLVIDCSAVTRGGCHRHIYPLPFRSLLFACNECAHTAHFRGCYQAARGKDIGFAGAVQWAAEGNSPFMRCSGHPNARSFEMALAFAFNTQNCHRPSPQRFGKVGFIKPVGQEHVPVKTDSGKEMKVDKDVKLIREVRRSIISQEHSRSHSPQPNAAIALPSGSYGLRAHEPRAHTEGVYQEGQ